MTVLEGDKEIGNLEEEEVAIIEEIAEVLERRQKDKLSALRDIPKKKLLEGTATTDQVLCKFKIQSITKINELFYAGAAIVICRLRVKINKVAERKEPMCQLESSKDKEVNNVRHWQTLEREYSIRVKTLGVVIEELKQIIVATAAKA